MSLSGTVGMGLWRASAESASGLSGLKNSPISLNSRFRSLLSVYQQSDDDAAHFCRTMGGYDSILSPVQNESSLRLHGFTVYD